MSLYGSHFLSTFSCWRDGKTFYARGGGGGYLTHVWVYENSKAEGLYEKTNKSATSTTNLQYKRFVSGLLNTYE